MEPSIVTCFKIFVRTDSAISFVIHFYSEIHDHISRSHHVIAILTHIPIINLKICIE